MYIITIIGYLPQVPLPLDLLLDRCEGIYSGSDVMDNVIMAPKKFAVFGNSYVSWKGRFGLQMHFCDGSNVRYFGRCGMRVGDMSTNLWDRLLQYRPNVCLLHLGGNDITDLCGEGPLRQIIEEGDSATRDWLLCGGGGGGAEGSLCNVSL